MLDTSCPLWPRLGPVRGNPRLWTLAAGIGPATVGLDLETSSGSGQLQAECVWGLVTGCAQNGTGYWPDPAYPERNKTGLPHVVQQDGPVGRGPHWPS